MEIVYFGHSFFEIRAEEGRVALDPFRKPDSPDITLITHEHPGHNKGDGFVIKAPGEYEVRDIFIIALPSFHDKEKGKKLGKNIIYTVEVEGKRLCHLGDIGHIPEEVEEIGRVDILFLPVGERTTIPLEEIPEVISLLEPKIIIPMHYRSKMREDLEPLDKFLKFLELDHYEEERLVIKDIPDDIRIISLKPIDFEGENI